MQRRYTEKEEVHVKTAAKVGTRELLAKEHQRFQALSEAK